jgi:GTP-binding protein
MKSNIVAIVGRPNVGKSTLFNRLLEKREAITHPTSGVTRDRNYGDVEWAGTKFTLIDTGGLVPNSQDIFETAIREQVNVALEEADFVLFLVDAIDGVTPIDQDIANIIRKSNKKVFLVVNKVDSENRENLVFPFYSLGIGEPLPVSAISGRTCGDLLDVVIAEMPAPVEEEESEKIKLAIIGKPNVGKSSIANALLGFDRTIVTPIAGTTRDSIDSILKYNNEEYVLVDTAGLRRKSKISENIEFFSTIRTIKSIRECDVAIVLLDGQTGLENQDSRIIHEALTFNKGIVLVVNKWDLVEKDSNTAKKVEEKIKEDIKMLDYVPVVFTSALTKQRIFKVIDVATKVNEERNKTVKTSDLNEALLPEIQLNPPSSSSGAEIKINYITQVKSKPPVIVFFTNNPNLIQESYKRFLERRIRNSFGFIGVPLSLQFRKK